MSSQCEMVTVSRIVGSDDDALFPRGAASGYAYYRDRANRTHLVIADQCRPYDLSCVFDALCDIAVELHGGYREC